MRAESTRSKGLEIPCQNTFKDKPAFIKHVKRLIKVLVARTCYVIASGFQFCITHTPGQVYSAPVPSCIWLLIPTVVGRKARLFGIGDSFGYVEVNSK